MMVSDRLALQSFAPEASDKDVYTLEKLGLWIHSGIRPFSFSRVDLLEMVDGNIVLPCWES